ncbi:MAG: hypothetical protein IPO13_14910 [Rhodocyclaceae bacterium]|nr:hypothetical protein [Rhodocyclaceae bacterium]
MSKKPDLTDPANAHILYCGALRDSFTVLVERMTQIKHMTGCMLAGEAQDKAIKAIDELSDIFSNGRCISIAPKYRTEGNVIRASFPSKKRATA